MRYSAWAAAAAAEINMRFSVLAVVVFIYAVLTFWEFRRAARAAAVAR